MKLAPLLCGLVIPAHTYIELGLAHSSPYVDEATHATEQGVHGTIEAGVKLPYHLRVYASHQSSLSSRFDKGVSLIGVKLTLDGDTQ